MFNKNGLILFLALAVNCLPALAVDRGELDEMRRQIDELRHSRDVEEAQNRRIDSAVDFSLESKFGPNAAATTRTGKLQIGGLLQVWYTSYQQDRNGLFKDSSTNTVVDSNAGQQNSSFRIRRSEISLTADITENVTGVIMFDPAREAASFPLVTDNQANFGIFKTANQVSPEFNNANGPGLGSTTSILNVQTGAGASARMLQDAYINFHDVVPHHDFQVGQFRPWLGQDGLQSDAQLDFVERSFIGVLNDSRDLGASIHGTWLCDRLQYWTGVFDGAGNYFGTAGQFQNRTDDNNAKDFNFRILGRPLWESDKWGSLEMGVSGEFGTHGGDGHKDPINDPTNGLNRKRVAAYREDLFGNYKAGGVLKGLWLRGEWMRLQDRNAPGTVADLQGGGGTDFGNTGSGSGMALSNPKPQKVLGYNVALGYKLKDSIFSDCGHAKWIDPFEIVFRFDSFQNVIVADLDPGSPHEDGQSDVQKTRVYTFGLNYFIKGDNAKIQANYNHVMDPISTVAGQVNFHHVRNDSFVLNFQVGF